MIYREEKGDLFNVNHKYYLVHCISGDFKLGAGIAVKFDIKYDMKYKLKKLYPSGVDGTTCILIDNVLNLITKEKYWHKPTYTTLRKSLEIMKEIIIKNNIKYIAMPKIGCGLDKLEWNRVKDIIQEIFKEIDIEILICYL